MPGGDCDRVLSGEPAIRTIAMPADTNPAGDIFGGWLMGQMGLAAGNVAGVTQVDDKMTVTATAAAARFHTVARGALMMRETERSSSG